MYQVTGKRIFEESSTTTLYKELLEYEAWMMNQMCEREGGGAY